MDTQVIEAEADSLEDAKAQAKAKMPAGMEIISVNVLSDGSLKTIRCVAETVDKARIDARSKVPSNGLSITEKQIAEPRHEVIRVEAFDEQTAKSKVKEKLGDAPVIIKSIRVAVMGRKGFLGIGRQSNQYEANIFHQAIVEVTYKTKVRISAKFGEPLSWLQKDQNEAIHWFALQGFMNSYYEGESKVKWFISMSNKADESSLWEEAWGGYHHALISAVALNLKDIIPEIFWHLGRAHTGLAHYDLAIHYLEDGYNLAQKEGNDDLCSRILLEIAVVGKLSEKHEIVQQAFQRVDSYLFPSGGDLSRVEKAALTMFHEGMKNQMWRRNDEPVPYCLVHATGFYQVSLDLNRRIHDKRGISVTLINMGHVWKMRGEQDRAMICWRESIPFLEELNDQQNITSVKKWMNKM
jgi:hypothetical protein